MSRTRSIKSPDRAEIAAVAHQTDRQHRKKLGGMEWRRGSGFEKNISLTTISVPKQLTLVPVAPQSFYSSSNH